MKKRVFSPYVPSPPEVAWAMLDLAEVKEDELIYDLGCGDGRILLIAALDFGAKGVGVEIDSGRYRRAKRMVKSLNLTDKIDIIHGDVNEVDLRDADVVTLYLTPEANRKLKRKFENELREKARVVSHDFKIEGWKPSYVLPLFSRADYLIIPHKIFLYRMREIYKTR